MTKLLQLVTIVSFLLIFVGLNTYIFLRLRSLFPIKNSWIMYLVIALFVAAYPLSIAAQKIFPSIFSTGLQKAASILPGIMLFLFSALLIFEIINLLFSPGRIISGIVIISVVMIATIYAIANASTIRTETIELEIEGLKEDMKAVQLSDLHIGAINTYRYMDRVAKMTNKLNPDVVLITGDLFDSSSNFDDKAIEAINKIRARKYFITGNHERYEGMDKVEDAIKKTDVIFLQDEVAEFRGIEIIGLSDPENEFGRRITKLKQLNINKSKPSILLYHQPKGFDDARAAGIDLMLCGHTHNGQIFPFNLIVKVFYPYIKGLYEHDGMHVYVSQGTGTWGPPMRLGSRNEITFFDLKKSS